MWSPQPGESIEDLFCEWSVRVSINEREGLRSGHRKDGAPFSKCSDAACCAIALILSTVKVGKYTET